MDSNKLANYVTNKQKLWLYAFQLVTKLFILVLLNFHPHKKTVNKSKSTENILARMNTEMEAELAEIRKQKEVLMQERNTLLDSLKRTNEEFILLKKKRIQDVSNRWSIKQKCQC